MKNKVGLKSKSGIHRLISALEDRGFIKKLEELGFEFCTHYSNNFPAIPLISFGGFYKAVAKKIAQIFPSNFSHSITVLVRKAK